MKSADPNTGSASLELPQDAQDKNFMTRQEDYSLSARVALAPAVSSSPL